MLQVMVNLNYGGMVPGWKEFGPKVHNLAEARIIVKVLDYLYESGQLPTSVDGYDPNDTEIQAVDLENPALIYEYVDQDPTGASDGVWF